MCLTEFSSNDTLPEPSCNPLLTQGALPCDAWHHYYHYQSSAQYLWLAETLRALGQEADAQAAYKRALFQDHFNQEALEGKAEAMATRAPEYAKHPLRDAEFLASVGLAAHTGTALHDEAAAHYEVARYDQALVLLNKTEAGHSNSYFLRGRCHFLKREFEMARADITEAIRLSHLGHDAYHRHASGEHLARGKAYAASGELELAISDFTKALDLHRGNQDALAARAQSYRVKGNIALAEMDELLLIAPVKTPTAFHTFLISKNRDFILDATTASAFFLWLGSLFFPALGTGTAASPHWYYGFFILIQGPIGIVFLEPGWYANVFFVCSLIGLFRGRLKYSYSDGAGLLLALSSLQPLQISGHGGSYDGEVCTRGPGFWMWLASFVTILAGSLWARHAKRSQKG